jgi:hypothetical protein
MASYECLSILVLLPRHRLVCRSAALNSVRGRGQLSRRETEAHASTNFKHGAAALDSVSRHRRRARRQAPHLLPRESHA